MESKKSDFDWPFVLERNDRAVGVCPEFYSSGRLSFWCGHWRSQRHTSGVLPELRLFLAESTGPRAGDLIQWHLSGVGIGLFLGGAIVQSWHAWYPDPTLALWASRRGSGLSGGWHSRHLMAIWVWTLKSRYVRVRRSGYAQTPTPI